VDEVEDLQVTWVGFSYGLKSLDEVIECHGGKLQGSSADGTGHPGSRP
jgi:hypothetical protein